MLIEEARRIFCAQPLIADVSIFYRSYECHYSMGVFCEFYIPLNFLSVGTRILYEHVLLKDEVLRKPMAIQEIAVATNRAFERKINWIWSAYEDVPYGN